ncbi:MAG: non-homologous end-joining DNA ligase [Bacillota bacterium]|nr:non-homologous end-joining DNA ligase [Bacillota bacterium]
MLARQKNEIEFSGLDKLFFASTGITKGDLINYYKKIAAVMILHLRERALTMHRFPDGIEGEGFYQQEALSYFPSWIERVAIAKKEGGRVTHVVCNNPDTLLYLANQACVTFHVWLSRVSEPEKPDKMIFDLDPAGGKYRSVVRPARTLKEILEKIELPSYLMSTGSKGVHVVVPVMPQWSFDEVRQLAREIAGTLVEKYPREVTTEQRKKKRDGKLFVDYLRNAFGQSSVAPYSIRALPGAPVATPLDWEEFSERTFNPQKYNINNIIYRLGQKEDPWNNIYASRASLKRALAEYSLWGGSLQ